MVFKIAILVAVVIVALLVFAATKPNSFRVQRSIRIHASQEKVFPFINDLHRWEAWSADNGGDGTAQKIYSGPASGTGAAAEWNSSGRAGAAKMTITESVVASKVSVKVDWRKPFDAHNLNEFTIQAQGDEAEVTWSIQASALYLMKVIGIFVNMESEFGKHMESGLKNLKDAAEKKESEASVGKIPG
jgi:polyketide cyclase/dehydrase/lipid transport protein